MSQPSEIAILGLGAMGSGLANAFVSHKHRVTVWNRSPGKMAPFVQAGASPAASPAEAIAASPVIMMVLSDLEAVNNVLEAPGVAAGLKGKTLLQMTIGTAEGIRAQQTWAKEHGCKFVVGLPVSYPRTVGQPNCLLVFAGDPAFNDHTTLLGSLGECQYVGEDPVEVLRTSYALGPMIIGTLALFFETAAAARQSGLSMSRYYSLTRLILDVITDGMREGAFRVATGNYAGDQASIDVTIAAMHDFCKAMETSGGSREDLAIGHRAARSGTCSRRWRQGHCGVGGRSHASQ